MKNVKNVKNGGGLSEFVVVFFDIVEMVVWLFYFEDNSMFIIRTVYCNRSVALIIICVILKTSPIVRPSYQK